MKKLNWKAIIGEIFGTFVLVFFACGTAAYTNGSPVPTALAFGLVIVAMAYTIGRVSGCHINPAVSFGLWLDKRMSTKDLVSYIVAQFIGAFLGGLLLFGIIKMTGMTTGNACNGLVGVEEKFNNYLAAILIEIVLTCIFVYVILTVTDGKNESIGKKAGLVIGLTLTLVHLLGIGFTGTSVNPARSFGTAMGALIFTGDAEPLKVLWVFLAAPILGSIFAVFFYRVLHKEEK